MLDLGLRDSYVDGAREFPENGLLITNHPLVRNVEYAQKAPEFMSLSIFLHQGHYVHPVAISPGQVRRRYRDVAEIAVAREASPRRPGQHWRHLVDFDEQGLCVPSFPGVPIFDPKGVNALRR